MKTPDQFPTKEGITDHFEVTEKAFTGLERIMARIAELPSNVQQHLKIIAPALLFSMISFAGLAQTTNEQPKDTTKHTGTNLFGQKKTLTPEQKEKIKKTTVDIYEAATKIGDVVTDDTKHEEGYEKTRRGLETIGDIVKIFEKDK